MKQLLKFIVVQSLGFFATASATTVTGSIGSHDPSRMVLCNGKYYICSTGGGMKVSTDRIQWTNGINPFKDGLPAWAKELIPTARGIWAPDIIFWKGRYLLYYSVSNKDSSQTCVGLTTSPTLDPDAPGYGWTDQGLIVSSVLDDKRGSIDPAPFIDADGKLFLSYGSGFRYGNDDAELFVIKIDQTTGLSDKADMKLYPVAYGHIEAVYIHYRDGFYYIFWNSGGCCNGAASTYRIHMARSKSATGPYVNKAGKERASDILMQTDKDAGMHGPGHIGILGEDGVDRFVFHYYPPSGRSVIGLRTLVWEKDGWPRVGRDLEPGTYKINSFEKARPLGANGEKLEFPGAKELAWTLAPSKGADSTPDGYYNLSSANGNLLTLRKPQVNQAAQFQLAPSDNSDNQRWLIEETADGEYRIQSRTSADAVFASKDTRTWKFEKP